MRRMTAHVSSMEMNVTVIVTATSGSDFDGSSNGVANVLEVMFCPIVIAGVILVSSVLLVNTSTEFEVGSSVVVIEVIVLGTKLEVFSVELSN